MTVDKGALLTEDQVQKLIAEALAKRDKEEAAAAAAKREREQQGAHFVKVSSAVKDEWGAVRLDDGRILCDAEHFPVAVRYPAFMKLSGQPDNLEALIKMYPPQHTDPALLAEARQHAGLLPGEPKAAAKAPAAAK